MWWWSGERGLCNWKCSQLGGIRIEWDAWNPWYDDISKGTEIKLLRGITL